MQDAATALAAEQQLRRDEGARFEQTLRDAMHSQAHFLTFSHTFPHVSSHFLTFSHTFPRSHFLRFSHTFPHVSSHSLTRFLTFPHISSRFLTSSSPFLRSKHSLRCSTNALSGNRRPKQQLPDWTRSLAASHTPIAV